MLKISKENRGGATVLKLAGVLDEGDDPKVLAAGLSGKVVINTKEVTRLNSMGIKVWIQFLNDLKRMGCSVSFEDLAIVFVEQMNMISNFGGGAQVISLMVPFECTACHAVLSASLKSFDLKQVNFYVPDVKCPKCNAAARFDDDPEEYFQFLK